MANQIESIHREGSGQESRQKANARLGCEDAALNILAPWGFCPVCFLTFGSEETRVFEGDTAVHPRCVERPRRDAA